MRKYEGRKSYTFSLPERQGEFLPIMTMRDIRNARRFEIIITARSEPFEFTVMFFYSRNNHTVFPESLRIDEIRAIRPVPNFMTLIRGLEPFYKTVIQGSIATLLMQGIKKILSR